MSLNRPWSNIPSSFSPRTRADPVKCLQAHDGTKTLIKWSGDEDQPQVPQQYCDAHQDIQLSRCVVVGRVLASFDQSFFALSPSSKTGHTGQFNKNLTINLIPVDNFKSSTLCLFSILYVSLKISHDTKPIKNILSGNFTLMMAI